MPSKALEAAGARTLRNESFFGAPQLKRDPLDGSQSVHYIEGRYLNGEFLA